VPERDASSLAAAINRLLDDRELGARLGARARSRVQADHGWNGVARAFEAAYEAARQSVLSGLGTAD
jgi:glycosyltransferase involved in cell wall biosynthesis